MLQLEAEVTGVDWIDQSIDELEEVKTPYPDFASGLALSVYRARTKPIRDISSHELRTALDHKQGLQHLVPVAFNILEDDVLNDGGLYEGALLRSILLLPEETWVDKQLVYRADHLVTEFLSRMIKFDVVELKSGFPAVMGAYETFRNLNMNTIINMK